MPGFASFQKVRVGDVHISYLFDGGGVCDPLALFPSSNETAWSMYGQELTPDDELVTSIGGFLLHTGDRCIAVDAGLGPKEVTLPTGHFEGGCYLESLATAGAQPGDVTDLVFTHLHFDHCGWATCSANGRHRPTFPNARVHVSRVEWEYWQHQRDDPGPDPDAVMAPLEEHVRLLEDGDEIAPGVTVLSTPGHTPGHISLRVESGDERAVILGDVLYGPVHVLQPEWHVAQDDDRIAARESRRRVLRELAPPRTIGAGARFPDSAFGRTVPSGFGQHWAILEASA